MGSIERQVALSLFPEGVHLAGLVRAIADRSGPLLANDFPLLINMVVAGQVTDWLPENCFKKPI
jgi:hypothetical protein